MIILCEHMKEIVTRNCSQILCINQNMVENKENKASNCGMIIISKKKKMAWVCSNLLWMQVNLLNMMKVFKFFGTIQDAGTRRLWPSQIYFMFLVVLRKGKEARSYYALKEDGSNLTITQFCVCWKHQKLLQGKHFGR